MCIRDSSNGRLQNLKKKTLRYRFKICYIPGRKNCVSDTMSRHPSGSKSPEKMHLPDDVSSIYFIEILPPKAHQVLPSVAFDQTTSAIADEEELLNQSIAAITNTCNSVTWDMIKETTSSDNNMIQLTKFIESGFVQHLDELPEAHITNIDPTYQHWMVSSSSKIGLSSHPAFGTLSLIISTLHIKAPIQ